MGLLRDLASTFLEECPKLLDQLYSALRHGDLVAIEESAHTLKGMLGNLAAKGAFETACQLQAVTNQIGEKELKDLGLKLVREVKLLLPLFRSFLRETETEESQDVRR